MDRDISASRHNLRAADGARVKEAARGSEVANGIWEDCLTQFLGINRTDARCLDLIERHGRISAGELAQGSGLTTGAVTVVADRLEAAGYAARERDRHDRRKVWIVLTPLGRELLHRLFSHYQRVGTAIMARFTPDQIGAIVAFLDAGARVNLAQAALLERHCRPAAASSEDRLAAARAFQRDSQRNLETLLASLESGTYCPPHE